MTNPPRVQHAGPESVRGGGSFHPTRRRGRAGDEVATEATSIDDVAETREMQGVS
jgi:hypothetical protein